MPPSRLREGVIEHSPRFSGLRGTDVEVDAATVPADGAMFHFASPMASVRVAFRCFRYMAAVPRPRNMAEKLVGGEDLNLRPPPREGSAQAQAQPRCLPATTSTASRARSAGPGSSPAAPSRSAHRLGASLLPSREFGARQSSAPPSILMPIWWDTHSENV
jgi:hypothetical protein